MAKTRKAASAKKKAASKKPAGKKAAKKPAAKKKAASKMAKELDLRPLKKQIKAHVAMLSRATGGDKRVADAIASLTRVQAELDENCDPTMTIPLA